MRFIIFGLLFVSAIYFADSKSIAKRDVQTELMKSISDLLIKAHAAVETLEKSGKPALVNGLEKSIKFLVEVEGELKKLNPTTDLGKALFEGLQGLVKQGEAALEDDLKRAKGSFYEKTVEIVTAKTELKESVHVSIAVTEADKLKALMAAAQAKLEEEMKKFGHFYADDSAKAELLKQAETLKKSTSDLIAKLTGQGKLAVAEGIKKLENFVITAEQTLLKLDPKTDFGKSLLAGAESLLKQAELKLEEEVKKLSGTF